MSFADNPKAHFDYEILDSLEAGVQLYGHEVKSVRKGSASIKGAYVKIIANEAWLLGATIAPYQPGNTAESYDQARNRKLLLRRDQIKELIGKSQERGLTLVPLKLYEKNHLIKLEIGIARGKKKYDKRESIKKRDVGRKIRRALTS